LFNVTVMHEPFAWLVNRTTTTVNASSSSAVPEDVLHHLLGAVQLLAAGSPLTFVVLPTLLLCAVLQRNELAARLSLFLALAIGIPLIEALVRDDASRLALHDALPIFALTVVGIAWLYHSFAAARGTVLALAVAGLAISIPITWHGLDQHRYQSMEQAFHRAVSTGDDQEGTLSRGGLQVGVLSERAMAEFLLEHPGRVLTDNAQTFGVIALTGRPSMFLDRADDGDESWGRAARRPPAGVRYFLFAKNAPADRLRGLYPRAARGQDARLTTVFDTPRYRLVAVPRGFGRVSPQATDATAAPLDPTRNGGQQP
jgi:hypothetical protein